MLVLNLDDEDNGKAEEYLEEMEEEIITKVVEVHHRRTKRRTKLKKANARRRFDDFFAYEDHQSYNFKDSGQYHDHDYQVYPRQHHHQHDPYDAPDPHFQHHDHHQQEHDDYVHFNDVHQDFATIYRDVTFYPRRPVIRNPRDSRFFPGNEPAGVFGVDSRLLEFIRRRVNRVASVVQEP